MAGISGSADAAVNAFILMKVIGRDIWIGVWAVVLPFNATTRGQSGGAQKGEAGVIWRRFPKFAIGFLIASKIITIVSHGYSYADYKKVVLPSWVTPLQSLRVGAFAFTFVSIGRTTRIRDFAAVGAKPFYAFTAGVIVNVIPGFILSTRVFVDFWTGLAQ